MSDQQVDILLEYLKQKQFITELEKDILDTWYELKKVPFDRKSAKKKIIENNSRYSDIKKKIITTPGIIIKPFTQVSDEDVKGNLFMQLELLLNKEMEGKDEL